MGVRPASAARAVSRHWPAAGASRRLRLASEQPRVGKAEVGRVAVTQDDMVEHSNPKQLPGFNEALRQRAVFAAGRRIAAGVIVTTNEGCRIGYDGGFHDF